MRPHRERAARGDSRAHAVLAARLRLSRDPAPRTAQKQT